jgi:hypothetical protein
MATTRQEFRGYFSYYFYQTEESAKGSYNCVSRLAKEKPATQLHTRQICATKSGANYMGHLAKHALGSTPYVVQ